MALIKQSPEQSSCEGTNNSGETRDKLLLWQTGPDLRKADVSVMASGCWESHLEDKLLLPNVPGIRGMPWRNDFWMLLSFLNAGLLLLRIGIFENNFSFRYMVSEVPTVSEAGLFALRLLAASWQRCFHLHALVLRLSHFLISRLMGKTIPVGL